MARKRKPGKRTKSGRLSRAKTAELRDHGTPELQARRQLLTADGDPSLSATVPGVLYARGHLTQDQYNHAIEFRTLRHALYGAPWPVNYGTSPINEARFACLQERFDALVALLTQEQREVVSDVCAFDRWPNWFYVHSLGLRVRLPEDIAEHRLLISGLNALAAGVPRKRTRSRPLTSDIVFW